MVSFCAPYVLAQETAQADAVVTAEVKSSFDPFAYHAAGRYGQQHAGQAQVRVKLGLSHLLDVQVLPEVETTMENAVIVFPARLGIQQQWAGGSGRGCSWCEGLLVDGCSSDVCHCIVCAHVCVCVRVRACVRVCLLLCMRVCARKNRYNPPFTIPFLKLNEIHIPVDPATIKSSL